VVKEVTKEFSMDTPNNQHEVVLTRAGLDELKTEYEDLVQVKRPVAVVRLSDARELGDLSENSEYAAAKQDLAFMDGRIAELEEILHNAKVVTSHARGHVGVGSKVTVAIKGKKEIFTVVGEWEADPMQRKISHESPLGKALIGKKEGEEIAVEAPAGRILYKIVSIE
jgi:transcription elongation factor GreA